MKLISLNTWGGKAYEPLLNFVKQNQEDTDIFCFQEILSNNSGIENYEQYRTNLLAELSKILPNYKYLFYPWLRLFDPQGNKVDFDLEEGSAIFLKNDLDILNDGVYELVGNRFPKDLKKDFSNMPSILGRVTLTIENKKLHIFTIHGVSMPGDKQDTEERIEQSEKIIKVLEEYNSYKILCGDFNLYPETKSVKMLDGHLRNLIKEFSIKNTRSSLSPYFNDPDRQTFADYTFVSEYINVKSFAVPDVAISDHLPMILEFELSQ